MRNLTFDQLPDAVSSLLQMVSTLEQLISSNVYTNMTAEKPLTAKEASLFLSLQLSTVYSLVQKKAIPYHKQGGKLYFLRGELIEWIKVGKTNNLSTEAELQFLAKNKRKRII